MDVEEEEDTGEEEGAAGSRVCCGGRLREGAGDPAVGSNLHLLPRAWRGR